MIHFIEKNRFNSIYSYSLKLQSHEIIGMNIMGEVVTEEEFAFVISKTRKKFGGWEKK